MLNDGAEVSFQGTHLSKSLFGNKSSNVVFTYGNERFTIKEGPQSILKNPEFTLSDLVQIYGYPQKWIKNSAQDVYQLIFTFKDPKLDFQV